ncbi:MAG: redoxin domain-containing protein [Gemmatimonadetes bacterium]|nr:redoxin domain-containing protein [Gemmatimonadota bacterium]
MNAYRDQYATIFNGGKGVAAFAVSVDPDTTLASWAAENRYPVTFLSDVGADVGKKYGVAIETRIGMLNARVVYLIGPDGKIAHVMSPFRETDPTAYQELEAAVDRLAK